MRQTFIPILPCCYCDAFNRFEGLDGNNDGLLSADELPMYFAAENLMIDQDEALSHIANWDQ